MLPDLFLPIEKELQAKIREGSSPFLSLFEEQIPPSTKNEIKKILQSPTHDFNKMVDGLIKWPALMSTYLTSELNSSISEHFKVYPHLEKAFGISLSSASQKKSLWESFRMACSMLWLPVSPRKSGPHFMVTEYLRQMGVPLAYAGELANKMQIFGNNFGLPDENDPSSLRLWQDEFLKTLNPPFPKTARRAIELDSHAYYVQLFLDSFNKQVDDPVENPFQQSMLEALHTTQSTFKRIEIPRVVFHGDIIGVRLPSRSNQEWTIQVEDEMVFNDQSGHDPFVPIDKPLPTKVHISNEINFWSYDLWEDEKDNRMLLFGDKDVRLQNPIGFSSEEEYPIPPGSYVLLTRFNPKIDNILTEQLSELPEIFSNTLELLPGNSLEIRRGPAVLKIIVDAMPVIYLTGKKYQDQDGQELFAGNDTKIKVVIPEEQADQEFRLRVKSRSLGQIHEFLLSGDSIYQFDAAKLLKTWKPGVSLVTVDCLPQFGTRVLARSASLVWNGLKRMELGSFICSRKPENLIEQESYNFKWIEDERDACRLSIKNPGQRVWGLAFEDGNRRLICTWARPGLRMHLRSYGGGSASERTLSQGETLSIAGGQHEVLFVHGLGAGNLRLGDSSWILRADQQYWRAPLATLQDSANQYSSDLVYESADGMTEKNLLRFITPQHCDSFRITQNSEYFWISFQTKSSPELLWFQAKNLLSGSVANLYVDKFLEAEVQICFNGGGQGDVWVEGDRCSLKIIPELWDDGLWVIDVNVQCEGLLGPLKNSKHEEYCCVLPIIMGELVSPREYMLAAKEWSVSIQAAFFERLHHVLLHCYAQQAWDQMDWFVTFWRDLLFSLKDFANENHEIRQAIIKSMVTNTPKDTPPGWIPTLQIIDECPSLLACKSEYYSMLSGDGYFINCLKQMQAFNDLGLLSLSEVFHPALGLALFHGNKTCSAITLKRYFETWPNFDLEEHQQIILNHNWIPAEREYLGPLHYRYAIKRSLDLHGRSVYSGRNLKGISWGTLICKRSSLVNAFFKLGLPITSNEWKQLTSYGLESIHEDEEKTEFANGLSCYIATLAFFCRQEAHDGPSANDKNNSYLRQLQQSTAIEFEHAQIGARYLLGIGQELMGFYLLFWECLFQIGLKPLDE